MSRSPSASSICHGKYLSRGREPGGIEIGTGRITRASSRVDRNESVLLVSAAASSSASVSFAGTKPTAHASAGETISASSIIPRRGVHEAGWAGISWPEEYGGKGATLIEQAIFNEELAAQRVPLPANVLGLIMGGPVVIAHGTNEQKERWLDPILSGDEIWCQGFSEPESGSDLASLKSRAIKANGSWKITGHFRYPR